MNQSLTEIIPRMILSMAVVIGLMWLAARALQKRGIAKGPSIGSAKRAPILQVLARQGVGRRANVTVVRVGDKTLVIGVTENNVSVLSEVNLASTQAKHDGAAIDLDTSELESQWTGLSIDADANPASSQAWTGLLTQIRERTVRKA